MSANFSITYDARAINKPRVRGIGRYLYELVGHISRLRTVDIRLLGDRPDQPFQTPPTVPFRRHVRSLKGQHLGTWEQFYVPWRVRRSPPHIFHAPATTLPLLQNAPTVVTVHDIKPWARELDPWRRIYWHKVVTRGLEKADAIITPSASTCADIASSWPHLVQKIKVIPHGLSDPYMGAAGATRTASEILSVSPYLLYVGGAAKNKRFDIALEVFSVLKRKWKSLQLLACGFSTRATKKISLERALADSVRFMPFVTDEQMVDLYSNAAAVLYPTEYEGFGFPVLEAQACGTPIIVSSSAGSLAELPGPEVYFVASQDLSDWSDAAEYCVARKIKGEHDSRRAADWASQYTWWRSASSHLELYDSLA